MAGSITKVVSKVHEQHNTKLLLETEYLKQIIFVTSLEGRSSFPIATEEKPLTTFLASVFSL